MHRGSRDKASEKKGWCCWCWGGDNELCRQTWMIIWKVSGRNRRIKMSYFCRAAWQRVQQGQQAQSFKCCSVLAELCVSALCGSTETCRPAQRGDSDTTAEPFQTRLPCWCMQTPQAHMMQGCILKACLRCPIFLLSEPYRSRKYTATYKVTKAIFI